MVPNCKKVKYNLFKTMTPIELKRIKKDFLNFCKLKPPKNTDEFGNAYLEFINTSSFRE